MGEYFLDQIAISYLPILIFLGLALVIGITFILAAFIIAIRNPDVEKVSAYECGFNAFDDARMKFDVRFYLVAILFIIFDLEVAFLFPWAISFGEIGFFGNYLPFFLFFFSLFIAFSKYKTFTFPRTHKVKPSIFLGQFYWFINHFFSFLIVPKF